MGCGCVSWLRLIVTLSKGYDSTLPLPKPLASCPEDGQVGESPRVWPHGLTASLSLPCWKLKVMKTDPAGVFSASSSSVKACAKLQCEGLCLRSMARLPSEGLGLVRGRRPMFLAKARMSWLFPALWQLPACLAASAVFSAWLRSKAQCCEVWDRLTQHT